MLVAISLASCKHTTFLPTLFKWQMNAYTNWNLTLLITRMVLSIREWDPFLCVNSVGILLAFRTAFTQNLDDNIRKKLNKMNAFQFSRPAFLVCDFIVHTLPALAMSGMMIHQKRKIPFVSVTYALTLSTWFVFHQVGHLDASTIYVPHPWKRGWLAAVLGMLLTPTMIHSAQTRQKHKFLLAVFTTLLPYVSTRFDPDLKKKYDFEHILAEQSKKAEDTPKRCASENMMMCRRATLN